MNLLTVDHITKVYTQRELFHDASFYLQDGEKVDQYFHGARPHAGAACQEASGSKSSDAEFMQ